MAGSIYSTEIAQLESLAALRALESFIVKLKHSWVTLFIDNKVAVRTVTQGGVALGKKTLQSSSESFAQKTTFGYTKSGGFRARKIRRII